MGNTPCGADTESCCGGICGSVPSYSERMTRLHHAEGERESREDIAAGRVKKFASGKKAVEWLQDGDTVTPEEAGIMPHEGPDEQAAQEFRWQIVGGDDENIFVMAPSVITDKLARTMKRSIAMKQNDPPRSITITLPGVPDIALRKNKGDKTHWRHRQKAAKAMRHEARWLIRENLYERSLPGIPDELWILNKVAVHITQHWCGRPLDHESLASGVAPAVDAFMDTGVIEDDNPNIVVEYRLSYERVPHMTDRKVVITVSEVSKSEVV